MPLAQRPAAIAIKRIYEPPADEDGYRVLVDRLWPRGVAKEAARIDEWLLEIAPSTALRKWFAHQPERWAEFVTRYRMELVEPESTAQLSRLRQLAARRRVTLVYSARDEQHNNAVVIVRVLREG